MKDITKLLENNKAWARQVENLAQNTIVQKAWERGRKLSIHGWIYSISDGLIKDLKVTRTGAPAREHHRKKGY
jgi:carbonic anhydrase